MVLIKKVVIMGGGGVGKSCITIQLTRRVFVAQYDPTIENTYIKEMTVSDEVVMLEILDTAGQEDFTILRDTYIRGGEGFVLVYSITSSESFQQIPPLITQILEVKEVDTGVPAVLVGNKCDLEGDRRVSRQDGEELAKKHKLAFFESSAALRINIDEVFEELVKEILNQEPHKDADTPKPKPGKKFCVLL
eukprot:TRINITY_DN280_c0_g1_i2.p1 TRINITY_DN280_c0_g1~~TRINITY_DN280_c0_g1_i2.p1  ORF type:complete len:191 (+),score=27.44 TRINITY_DN280_c0_g1_i2:141-713(+)